MGHWSFVALAYGIVWSVIVVYFFFPEKALQKSADGVECAHIGADARGT
jgi:hypothetical protein